MASEMSRLIGICISHKISNSLAILLLPSNWSESQCCLGNKGALEKEPILLVASVKHREESLKGEGHGQSLFS